MKRFLLRLFLFALIECAIGVLICLVNFHLIKTHPYQLESSTHTLLLGDSHGMFAFNPKKISSSRNLSQKTEPYLVTYHKLKTLLPYNKQVKNIVLSYSAHSISAFYDTIFINPSFSKEVFRRVYAIMLPDDFADLPIDYLEYGKTFLKNMMFFPSWTHYSYIGNFIMSSGSNLHEEYLKAGIKNHYYNNKRNIGISKVMIQYLDAIIALARENGIRVFLVTPPTHKRYFELTPNNFKRELRETIKRLELTYKNLIWLDYSHLPMPADYFFDWDHLNLKGADKISVLIDKEIASLGQK